MGVMQCREEGELTIGEGVEGVVVDDVQHHAQAQPVQPRHHLPVAEAPPQAGSWGDGITVRCWRLAPAKNRLSRFSGSLSATEWLHACVCDHAPLGMEANTALE